MFLRRRVVYYQRGNHRRLHLLQQQCREPWEQQLWRRDLHERSSLSISDSQIVSNAAYSYNNNRTGGGIYVSSGSMTLQRCKVANNYNSPTSIYPGGGIYMTSSNGLLTIRDSEISGNSNDGICMNAGTLTMDNCTMGGNTASTGAGLYVIGGSSTLSQVTVSGNVSTGTSSAYGGGVRVDNGTCTLRQCTVANNTTTGEGGGIHRYGGTVILYNTIVAGNSATGAGQDVRGSFSTVSQYNFIGIVNDSIGLGDDPNTLVGVTGSPLDAMLDPLAPNGGYTATHRPRINSPVIDYGSNALALDSAGKPLQYDQRGAGSPRIFGSAVDIGSVEYAAQAGDNQPPTIATLSIPGTVHVGDSLTLTATGVADDHAVVSVSFYRDVNGNGLLDPSELPRYQHERLRRLVLHGIGQLDARPVAAPGGGD